jgi:hypothetical protein
MEAKTLMYRKKVFNYCLSRARRYIECALGIMSNKWRIFHRPLDVSIEFSEDIVKACIVVHNFVRMGDGYNFDNTLSYEGLFDTSEHADARGRQALQVRESSANQVVCYESIGIV